MRISTVFINLLVIVLSVLSPMTEAQQPNYLNHDCRNTATFSVNSTTYRANRDSLLSLLRSNGNHETGFYNTIAGRSPNMVYGLFLCRGDVSSGICQACVIIAAYNISQLCPVGISAVIWYDECLLRYSNQNIFSVLVEEPSFSMYSIRSVTQEVRFNQLATALVVMNVTATRAANAPSGSNKVATEEAQFSSSPTVYTLVHCTPDLSSSDCSTCLQGAIANLSDCCNGRQGGRVLKPSCTVRYDVDPFYGQTAVATPPPPTQEQETQNNSNSIIILVASLSAVFGLAVVSASGFFIWRRRNNQEHREHSRDQLLDMVEGRILNEHSTETFSAENVGNSQEFPSIQLDTLQAATNHFSHENKLGEGGFGPVYKGTLADGKEIAVKRLSRTSGQGLVEFKNEVMLIARLQHRNLVRLLGCCLEKNEKLLVYEFMPNRSLDVFLFDSNLAEQLDWEKRINIIKGIARGIMYLHEDSRLRIIHIYLKASNVLLDHKMNPKISDFGMARIFGDDRNQANTNRVVGTYGYMAPEYAMEGLFSIKSDVFSFGVILLEIISGKKNNGFHLSESGESLLTFAWKLWSKGEGMKVVDQLLAPSCVVSEAVKCIHIGLLCVQADPADRPTMSSVVVMLASDAMMLPSPAEPASYVGRAVAEPTESSSNDGVFSINEVTASIFSPR
ncbi:cysteine-rich RLK (RECEPTOR-like protein kinase) 10 [Hibiscus trionum]|uniref:non-specific serine/threonine protein kinase n=1 Tax=Hibiscus trionum TaxID=183268 RepID=A0A9W7HIM0_HIBTR|nr:cysteine-rich RLK (RECEPTOR-like protein kinase) 10 [Hibiscus trionum]